MITKGFTTALTFFVVLTLKTVNGQSTGSACSSRAVPQGVCLRLLDCPSLVSIVRNLLQTRPAPEVIAEYGCGTDSEGRFRLCCPNNEETLPTAPPIGALTSALGCGQRSVGDLSQTKWPFVAAVGKLYREKYFDYLCSGVFIHKQWVVMDKLCTYNILHVIPAELFAKNKSLEYIRIAETYTTDFTDDGQPSTGLVLLKLEQPLQNSEYMQTACLPDRQQIFDENTEFTGLLVGLGNIDGTEPTYILSERVRKWTCPNGRSDSCSMAPPVALCTSYKQPNKRPSFILKEEDAEGRYHLLGVGGFGVHHCFLDAEGVYTDITKHLRWINDHLKLTP